ncbi:sigma-54 dependent transcriptional regulator [Gemmatimonas sp.]|uniref:sigma-54-dependent transcriptional regulator n=1 Tax=Gemmatimonas sp. TaxID=1962908 RepID=UPI0022C023B6|nr:sigma-54 dependent transcriptional regulator [Gemmatimonas sp.]MCZ8203652.1 sigma-54 dependent transcriptional regulator [Gemmatimonas sp.]
MTTPATGSAVLAGESPIRVLIAEDEAHLGAILEQFMTARGFQVRMVRDGRSALELLRRELFDVALLDVVMPELDGLEVLRLVREELMPPEVIVITGNGTIETAMAALKLGAYDFLSKPYRMAEIEALVRRAWEKRLLVRRNRHLAARLHREETPSVFLTQYAPLRAVLAMVHQFAASPLPVLVTGEAGTGKRLLARVLHDQGGRPEAPFIRVDCETLTAATAFDELLGAPTGAGPTADDSADRAVGALELAAGGTLYLEHVHALPIAAQAALCHILDDGAFVPRRGERRVPLTARLVASTAHDLAAGVAKGTVHEGFLHRVASMRVVLPALRDRPVDVVLLAHHFLAAASRGRGLRLSDEAAATLERHSWPGNVRELQLTMQRAALVAKGAVVQVSDLTLAGASTGTGAGTPVAGSAGAGASLDDLERQHIAEALERTGWHQGRAAEQLGISPKTLYRKIREYGFKRPSGRNT